MITKRTFVDSMNKLQDLDEKLNAVDIALKDLSPDFGGFYIPDFFSLICLCIALIQYLILS